MRCPFCQNPATSVTDSRSPETGSVIRRRRQCPRCKKRFTTFERVMTIILKLILLLFHFLFSSVYLISDQHSH